MKYVKGHQFVYLYSMDNDHFKDVLDIVNLKRVEFMDIPSASHCQSCVIYGTVGQINQAI